MPDQHLCNILSHHFSILSPQIDIYACFPTFLFPYWLIFLLLCYHISLLSCFHIYLISYILILFSHLNFPICLFSYSLVFIFPCNLVFIFILFYILFWLSSFLISFVSFKCGILILVSYCLITFNFSHSFYYSYWYKSSSGI